MLKSPVTLMTRLVETGRSPPPPPSLLLPSSLSHSPPLEPVPRHAHHHLSRTGADMCRGQLMYQRAPYGISFAPYQQPGK